MSKSSFASYIEALQIFAKYETDDEPALHAEHDIIYAKADENEVSEEDQVRLKELGWTPDEENGGFSKFT